MRRNDADEPTPSESRSTGRGTGGSSRPWMRFAGLGMELATFTLVMAGLGYWLDTHRQHATLYGTAAGAFIGFTLGMIRFIRQAMQSMDD